MRVAQLTLLIILTIGVAGCSYSTDFVVVNQTDSAIFVVYKFKTFENQIAKFEIQPRAVLESELSGRHMTKWQQLSADRYEVDQANRIVKVSLKPHEALWVTSMSHYLGDDSPHDVARFPVQEISMNGPAGEMKFTGDKARKAFEYQSTTLYTLTYK